MKLRGRTRSTWTERAPWLLAPLGAATALALVGWPLLRRRRRSGSRHVDHVMTPDPVAVGEDTTVQDAARLMREHDVGSVPVVRDGRVVGMLSDRDIAMRVAAEAADAASVTVGDVASRDVVTVRPEQPLDEALRLMARHQVRRMPVVEDGDRLVGVVAQADIARKGRDEETGEVVERISEPTDAPRG